MPYYMIQATCTSESWASEVRNPQDPVGRIWPLASALGGTIESVYYAFCDHDIVMIVQAS